MEFLIKNLIILAITINVCMAAKNPLLAVPFFKDKSKMCELKADFLYLSKLEKSDAKKVVGLEIDSIVKKIKMNCGGGHSFAYILSNRIRTEYQTVVVWIKDKVINEVKILRFDEPERFKAPQKWLDQFKGKSLNEIAKVDGITGATLTANSIKKLAKEGVYFETK